MKIGHIIKMKNIMKYPDDKSRFYYESVIKDKTGIIEFSDFS